jgi:hypothetical protein
MGLFKSHHKEVADGRAYIAKQKAKLEQERLAREAAVEAERLRSEQKAAERAQRDEARRNRLAEKAKKNRKEGRW